MAERVDNLIRRFDLRGYLRRRRPIEAAGGKELRIDCPFCSDSGQHMYVNVERKLFHCFRCETSNPTTLKSLLTLSTSACPWARPLMRTDSETTKIRGWAGSGVEKKGFPSMPI